MLLQLTDSCHSFPVQRWRSKLAIEGRTEELHLQLMDSVPEKNEEPCTMWLASRNALDPKRHVLYEDG